MLKRVLILLTATVVVGLSLIPSATAQPGSPAKSCEGASNEKNSFEGAVGLPKGTAHEEVGDTTVVALIDYEPFTPYHRDFYAQHMPQHQDTDPTNDLPLHCSPEEWLPGFSTADVDSFQPLNLTLSDSDACGDPKSVNDPERCPSRVALSKIDEDRGEWGKVKSSGIVNRGTEAEADLGTHMYWIPGSKVVGALTFGTQGLNYREATADPLAPQGTSEGHGVGSTSAAVGNFHGTCPSCVFVFITVDIAGVDVTNVTAPHDTDRMEQALEWAYSQPWIDVVSMPGAPSATPATRERYYQGSDTGKQGTASANGKTIFISAGNGNDGGAGIVTSTTLQSSLQGPDWIVTVSGVDTTNDRKDSRVSFGKPADIAGPSHIYPTAGGSKTIGGSGTAAMANTSLAVAATSGTYAHALYQARRAMDGPSRTQDGGVIASGEFTCGSVRSCELGDGILTAEELRNRFFMGAQHSPAGMVHDIWVDPYVHQNVRTSWEEDFMAEGHGHYLGRCSTKRGGTAFQGNGVTCGVLPLRSDKTPGAADDLTDVIEPILQPLFGYASAREDFSFAEGGRPPGEEEWFIVDSFCRQLLWGTWSGGDYVHGVTSRPEASPDMPPLRRAYLEGCTLIPTPKHQIGDRTIED